MVNRDLFPCQHFNTSFRPINFGWKVRTPDFSSRVPWSFNISLVSLTIQNIHWSIFNKYLRTRVRTHLYIPNWDISSDFRNSWLFYLVSPGSGRLLTTRTPRIDLSPHFQNFYLTGNLDVGCLPPNLVHWRFCFVAVRAILNLLKTLGMSWSVCRSYVRF